jgi:hypothetical protein
MIGPPIGLPVAASSVCDVDCGTAGAVTDRLTTLGDRDRLLNASRCVAVSECDPMPSVAVPVNEPPVRSAHP